ncbi:MAG: nucleoside triphosphate pyrophosphohydrolase, partial [Alistipes sp.]|nr:nucleoside triphosphate pyrophosphohydrolase [Alistipes sp.]
FGDLFFALINACRLYGVDPESALALTNNKFQRRFNAIEAAAEAQGKTLQEMTLDEMEAVWQAAKKEE